MTIKKKESSTGGKDGKDRTKGLEELKELLLEERKQIMGHLVKLHKDSNEELGPLSGDSADIASMEISQSSLSKLGGREQKLLKKIDEALERFEDGTYGICQLTGEEIPLDRLRARPTAQYTVEAKEMLERRERGYRKGGEDRDEDWDSDFLD